MAKSKYFVENDLPSPAELLVAMQMWCGEYNEMLGEGLKDVQNDEKTNSRFFDRPAYDRLHTGRTWRFGQHGQFGRYGRYRVLPGCSRQHRI